ncbi:MAG: chromate transporter [Clostridiales bacterium]|nr:chromate transporter [Candidatus Equinaster intestinalis]
MILFKLFYTFFKIGLFTFGGGYAMLPLIQSEVAANGWLTNTELVNFIAVSESTPGPFAINIATYVGTVTGGFLGAVCATLGVVMPSFIIILIVAGCYEKFKESKTVKGIMSGLKPAVIGLIGAAILSIAATVFVPDGFSFGIFTNPFTYVALVIFAAGLIMAFKKLHPIIIICISAVAGIAAGYLLPLIKI